MLAVTVRTSTNANWRNRIARVLPALRTAEEAAGRRLVARARQLSQGTYSTAALRRLKHPYRIGGTPPADPAIINRQGGLFERSWQFEIVPVSGGSGVRVFNSDPKSRFMAGTRTMIARPILEALMRKERQAWVLGMRTVFASIFVR